MCEEEARQIDSHRGRQADYKPYHERRPIASLHIHKRLALKGYNLSRTNEVMLYIFFSL